MYQNKCKQKTLSFRLVMALGTSLLIAACYKDQGSPAPIATSEVSSRSDAQILMQAEQEKKLLLLHEISGVWNPSTADLLYTINYADSRLQIISGDTFVPVILGDVDVDNSTVNLKLTRYGKPEIWTLQKVWNVEHTGFNLRLISANGLQDNLMFVRKISTDDINRIAQLGVATPVKPSRESAAISQLPVATSSPETNSSAAVTDMWLGQIDMNMRSCPGTTCSALIVIPKNSKISVDLSTTRSVTEASGMQTPWVRVTYSGDYCATSAATNQASGCVPDNQTSTPLTGWMNYQRLLPSPLEPQ